MKANELLELFDAFTAKQRAIIEKKNADYALVADALHNFKVSAATAGIKPEQGCLNQISIKATRLGVLFAGKKPDNESIEDSMGDLFSYAFLLYAIIKDQ